MDCEKCGLEITVSEIKMRLKLMMNYRISHGLRDQFTQAKIRMKLNGFSLGSLCGRCFQEILGAVEELVE